MIIEKNASRGKAKDFNSLKWSNESPNHDILATLILVTHFCKIFFTSTVHWRLKYLFSFDIDKISEVDVSVSRRVFHNFKMVWQNYAKHAWTYYAWPILRLNFYNVQV